MKTANRAGGKQLYPRLAIAFPCSSSCFWVLIVYLVAISSLSATWILNGLVKPTYLAWFVCRTVVTG